MEKWPNKNTTQDRMSELSKKRNLNQEERAELDALNAFPEDSQKASRLKDLILKHQKNDLAPEEQKELDGLWEQYHNKEELEGKDIQDK